MKEAIEAVSNTIVAFEEKWNVCLNNLKNAMKYLKKPKI